MTSSASILPTPALLRKHVTVAIDALVAAAEPYQGMFPSILDRATGAMPEHLPAPILGQRNGDRAHRGSNLMHDLPLLGTMYGLAKPSGFEGYGRAADRYLERFARCCTNSPSGLFAWGEHAFWHLDDEAVGSSHAVAGNPDYPHIHDHLRQAPEWLWRKLDRFKPGCVRRFALGLDWHLKAGEPMEYSRHACLDAGAGDLREHRVIDREGRPRRMTGPKDSSVDFPRHCGFYLFDAAVALALYPGDAELRRRVTFWSDYWWRYAARPDHLLPMVSRGLPDASEMMYAPLQTLSLGISMIEASRVLAVTEPGLSSSLHERGLLLSDAFFAAPHDAESGQWWCTWSGIQFGEGETACVWGSSYGHPPLCYVSTQCLGAYRMTGQSEFLGVAVAIGQTVLAEPMPEGVAIPAMDAGLSLAMLADLYEITGDECWRSGSLELAGVIISRFLDQPLPRAAQGYEWYDSQTGTGFLLYGIARLADVLNKPHNSCGVEPDYTAR